MFVATQYWRAWSMPFVGDDFVILDRVSRASFWDLWSRRPPLLFEWYRPVSRELHYWVLYVLGGARELPFHLVSLLLWIAVHAAFFRHVASLAGVRAAAIATSGAACLSAWGASLLWIAGVQDLWMLLFGLLYLTATRQRRGTLAAAWLMLALLSKESAAVFVLVASIECLWADGEKPSTVLRTLMPSVVLAIGWFLIHPTLAARMAGRSPPSPETMGHGDPWRSLGRLTLAVFDLDALPAPEHGWWVPVLVALLACIPLFAIVALSSPAGEEPVSPIRRRRLLLVTGAWAAAGFVPALLPFVGWHAYYGIIGLLGGWAFLGILLSGHRQAACAVLGLMTLLRAARADTPAWDWGTEWYQLRAGNTLRVIRAGLRERYPSLSRDTRVYFTHVPNNVGLIAGNSPALRVWYGDSTLRAFFLRDYVVRDPDEAPGKDLFFSFDTLRGLVEIRPNDASPPLGARSQWQREHYNLATALLLGGDLEAAAQGYLNIALADSRRTDCAMFAAACYERLRRPIDRERALSVTAASGMSHEESAARLRALLETFPSRAPRPPGNR